MELINNTSKTLKDDLSVEIKKGSKLSIAAACFSIYALSLVSVKIRNTERCFRPKKQFSRNLTLKLLLLHRTRREQCSKTMIGFASQMQGVKITVLIYSQRLFQQ